MHIPHVETKFSIMIVNIDNLNGANRASKRKSFSYILYYRSKKSYMVGLDILTK